MLGLNIESNLAPKTAWLKEYLGFSKVGVSSVLKAFPAVLALNVENLEGKVRPTAMPYPPPPFLQLCLP